MDEYAFKTMVAKCTAVTEATSYMEMFSYSDPSFNSIVDRRLSPDDFDNFLHQKGGFAPVNPPSHARLVAGIRLIVQINPQHPETFAPHHISMSHDAYVSMVEAFHLPRIAIETSSVVGPYFWSDLIYDDDENPFLQIVFRKSDVRKMGSTRGWELILSHEFKTGMTTGFCKGSPSSRLSECIKHLKACSSELGHAMLFPVIMLGQECSSNADIKQRNARKSLRALERTISLRNVTEELDQYCTEDGLMDLDSINRDLVDCQAQVLSKRPMASLEIITSIEEASQLFIQVLSDDKKSRAIQKLHRSIYSRLQHYRKRWNGIDVYANTSLLRLEVQRSTLYNVIAQKDSRLNLQMAADQRKLAHTTKRESKSMKGISLLGTIFLPGAFLASIFSTSFFNFRDAADIASAVSPSFWVYWAVTIPCTLLVVAIYFTWERRRAKAYEREDIDIEMGIERLEAAIMGSTRNLTMGKMGTWDVRNEKRTGLSADDEND